MPTQQCEQEIVLKSVEFLEVQGAGEGKLEMIVRAESGSLTKELDERADCAPGLNRADVGNVGSVDV